MLQYPSLQFYAASNFAFFFIGSHPSSGIYGILGQTLQLLPLVPHELIREDVRESVFWSNTSHTRREKARARSCGRYDSGIVP